jgi:hypothetical protein
MASFESLFPTFLQKCAELHELLRIVAFMLFIVGTIMFVVHGFSGKTLMLHLVRLFILTALLVMLPQWGNQVQQLGDLGLGTVVEACRSDLAKPGVVEELANCDFLFGCMDSADGRDLLNRVATYYSLPYIDVGVRLDADGEGGIEQICCAIHYLLPGGSSLLSRGVITSEQVQAQAMRRTNPDQYSALEKEGYIKGIAVDRPAVVSINGFAATHAVNEMLARLHPFRRDSGEEYRYQVFSLSDGAWLKLPDGPACTLLARYTGRGDAQPLLGNPALS